MRCAEVEKGRNRAKMKKGNQQTVNAVMMTPKVTEAFLSRRSLDDDLSYEAAAAAATATAAADADGETDALVHLASFFS